MAATGVYTAARTNRYMPPSTLPTALPAATAAPLATAPRTKVTKDPNDDAHAAAPPIIVDSRSDARYKRGKFLGKGGFAIVHEVTDMATGVVYACKIIAKKSILQNRAKQKLSSEIKLHRALAHKNIVAFQCFFDDATNVYILLELCPNKSFMELLRERRKLTEPEVAYYLWQLLDALEYMHGLNIIHRDLKLGNVFLDEALNVKIGDLGLATKIEHAGQRKRTICGTPNYIAPEILDSAGKGHSHEVDIWSLGCMVYTFLVGKPPFETDNVKATYSRIKANLYTFPEKSSVSEAGRSLIRSMLQSRPEDRPSIAEIRVHRFFTGQRVPSSLPLTALHRVPRLFEDDAVAAAAAAGAAGPTTARARTPLSDRNELEPARRTSDPFKIKAAVGAAPAPTAAAATAPAAVPAFAAPKAVGPSAALAAAAAVAAAASAAVPPPTIKTASAVSARAHSAAAAAGVATAAAAPAAPAAAAGHAGVLDEDDADCQGALSSMHRHLTQSFAVLKEGRTDALPAAAATVPDTGRTGRWVTKWVDYSNKYGLGYQLSDGTIGVYFNDITKILLAPNGVDTLYVERVRPATGGPRDELQAHTLTSYPAALQKKTTLLKYFKNYLMEHLEKGPGEGEAAAASGGAGEAVDSATAAAQAADSATGRVYVQKWMRTKHAIIFRLSDKTVQVNFFDHTKLILTAEAQLITYVNKERVTTTQTLAAAMHAPSSELVSRLKYANDILGKLLAPSASGAAAKGKASSPHTGPA